MAKLVRQNDAACTWCHYYHLHECHNGFTLDLLCTLYGLGSENRSIRSYPARNELNPCIVSTDCSEVPAISGAILGALVPLSHHRQCHCKVKALR